MSDEVRLREVVLGPDLLYLDETGEQMTDTWHRTPDDALSQAQFEFNVAANDWRRSAA